MHSSNSPKLKTFPLFYGAPYESLFARLGFPSRTDHETKYDVTMPALLIIRTRLRKLMLELMKATRIQPRFTDKSIALYNADKMITFRQVSSMEREF